MELWIRSQNKLRLIKPIDIYIKGAFDYDNRKCEIGIYALNLENAVIRIGTYKTTERALEVLDEIQEVLKPKVIVNSGRIVAETCDGTIYREPDEVEIKELNVVVYEMPKE